MSSKLVKFNNHLTSEEIDLKKEEYMSIINEPTRKALSGSFDLELHKDRGMNSRMHTEHNFTGKIYKDRILDDIEFFKEEKPNLLDVGCGSGNFVREMIDTNKFSSVSGLDPFSKNNFCKKVDKEHFIDSWSHQIPLDDNSVDIITCCEVLEHVPEVYVLETFKEFKRVCSWRVYGQISTRIGGEKYRDGVHAHICYAPAEWWFDKIEQSGLELISGDLYLTTPPNAYKNGITEPAENSIRFVAKG